MKRNINTNKIILLFAIITLSCSLTPYISRSDFIKIGKKLDKIEKLNENEIEKLNENFEKEFFEPRLKELKVGKVSVQVFLSYVDYTWTKSGNPRQIRDEKNEVIQELDNKLRYSYVFAPVDSGFVSPFSMIVFETTSDGQDIEVKELKLICVGSDIDFENYRTSWTNKKIPKSEESKEKGFITAYNFGTTDNKLMNAFIFRLKNNEKCKYVFADLTLCSKNTKEIKTYKISLSPELFYDTLRLTKEKYPNVLIDI